MRRLVPVVLCSIALSAQALVFEVPGSTPGIDLDQPGALDALKRDNPAHFEVVMKKVDEVQASPIKLNVLQNLRLDARKPMENGRLVEPISPARSRIGINVDGTTYLITVRYTKDPATLVPAR
ncbi:MAG TPA: hypothetical protein VKR38_03920 [Usitatibacter sp.]|nr:hypothetical protein [Usitatibacter sp.]